MKVLVLHLSDIHFVSEDDWALKRVPLIVDSVKNVEDDIDIGVIAVTGDIAFSGLESQYLHSINFVQDLAKKLGEALTRAPRTALVPIHVVAVPGNHDCDFSMHTRTREEVFKNIRTDESLLVDDSVIELCTEVQTAFFSTFLEEVETPGSRRPIKGLAERLGYQYRFEHKSASIRFVCLNSAWMSQLNEDYGGLRFPADKLPDQGFPDDLTICLMHHPFNWFDPVTSRQLRAGIQNWADIIFTGHEHEVYRDSRIPDSGDTTYYLEGGLLQTPSDRTDDSSDFHLLIYDTGQSSHKYAHVVWDRESYTLGSGSALGQGGFGLVWERYSASDRKHQIPFSISDSMARFLEDPGIILGSEKHGLVKLSSIFVWPDINLVSVAPDLPLDIKRGPDVPGLIGDNPHLIISGDNQAGKTTLAKRVFEHLHKTGSVPLFLSGRESAGAEIRKVDSLVEREFGRQYSVQQLDAWRNLDVSRRAILLDDYDSISTAPRNRQEFLIRLTRVARRVIVFVNDLAMDLEQIVVPQQGGAQAAELSHFRQYRIRLFGHSQRNEFVARWLIVQGNLVPESLEFVQALIQTIRTINNFIGRGFVPAYPIYLLAVIVAHQQETLTRGDMAVGTYGYLYDVLIQAALAQGRSRADYDVARTFLSLLAFEMFTKHELEISLLEFEERFSQYRKEYSVTRTMGWAHSQLMNGRILIDSGDHVTFKYPYVFYYFIALYMRDRITDPSVRWHIGSLAKDVSSEQAANVLLFLAHLSKDPFIIEQVMSAAADHYASLPEARLEEDVEFLKDLAPLESQEALPDVSPADERNKMFEEMDRVD